MKLTEEQAQAIIQAYQEGEPSTEIAKRFQLSHPNRVPKILRERGIPRTRVVKVSDEQQAKIVADYIAGISSPRIATELGIDDGTVRRILKRKGIAIRPPEESHRTYDINQNYFEKIEDEKRAYFLGFLYADGHLSKIEEDGSCGWGITISLHPQDIDVLEKLSNEIYGFVKISNGEPLLKDPFQHYKTLSIYSKTMWNDLNKHGCGPQKTFDIRFPDFLSPELLQHFIRGYFDGDGCLSIANIYRPVIDFTSNLEFIIGLTTHLQALGYKCGKIVPGQGNMLVGNVQLMAWDNLKKLLDYMYNGATVYMSRKKEKYGEFLKLYHARISKKAAKETNISLYGTTFVPEWNSQALTKANVTKLSNEDKDKAAKDMLGFYRERGFPYPLQSKDDLLREFANIQNTNVSSIEKDGILRIDNQCGAPIFKHFSPHFFEVKSGSNMKRPSMLEAFNDNKLLLKVLQNRLKQNYQISGNMLRQGLSNSHTAFKASSFNTLLAKYIYQQHTKTNDIIYDFSMGFGQRLVGALSLPYPLTYIGIDAMNATVESNQAIYDFFNAYVPALNKKVELIHTGAENFCPEQHQGKVDMAFSSPPYFNLEYYSDDVEQAYSSGSYIDFIHSWWTKTVANINNLLKPGGSLLLNINDQVDGFNIGKDMTDIIRLCGFELVQEYRIKLSKNGKKKPGLSNNKYEPIYVFKKGNK